MFLNEVNYFVLQDNEGNIIDAVNLGLAKQYSYLTAGRKNTISSDETTYCLSLPVYDNHIQIGMVYLVLNSGNELVELKKKNLLTALFSLSILLAGIVFTYLLSSISFKPFARVISVLGKAYRSEQLILLNEFISALDEGDRNRPKALLP